MKILLDTNFLIYCTKQKVDYLKEISKIINGKAELIALSSMISELERFSSKTKKLKDKKSAELALKILKNYIKKKKIRVLKTDKSPDSAIKELSKKEKNIIVATADRELKKKIKGKTRILSIRQKRKLELT
tara:strand:- start:57 stop:449 length:393 start_codon:yes stop_codon:yes gene_type:complete